MALIADLRAFCGFQCGFDNANGIIKLVLLFSGRYLMCNVKSCCAFDALLWINGASKRETVCTSDAQLSSKNATKPSVALLAHNKGVKCASCVFRCAKRWLNRSNDGSYGILNAKWSQRNLT